MKKSLLIFFSFWIFSCINRNSNQDIVSVQDTCYIENNLLSSKIFEFTELAFPKLKNSNFKKETEILENLYPDIKDTLFTFSTTNETYSFIVTHLGKIIPDCILINYGNHNEDEMGFYNHIQELITPLDSNKCNVTILTTETYMSYLYVLIEDNKIMQLVFTRSD